MNQEPPDADLERMLRDYFAESEQRPPDFETFWRTLDATLNASPAVGTGTLLIVEVAPRPAPASNGAAPESFNPAGDEVYDFVLDDTLEESMTNGHDQSGRQPSTTERSNRWDTSRRGLSPRATAIAAIAAALILAVIATTIYTQFATRRTPHPAATATAGAFMKITLPNSSNREISALAPAPDGSLWFADFAGTNGKISHLKPDGSLTEYPIPTADKVKAVYLYSLVFGPDGNLWFSGDDVNGSVYTPFLKRMTPDGVVTDLELPANLHTSPLVNGPDGALWFIGSKYLSANPDPSYVQEIGRITMDGRIIQYPIPAQDNGGALIDLCVGPDQMLWYTWNDASGNSAKLNGRIGRVSLSGQIQEFSVPYAPKFITSGKDGALWYSELATTGIAGDSAKARKGFLGRITTAGVASEIPIDPNASVFQIAAGSDGGIWYIVRDGDGRALSRVTANGGVKSFTTPATPPFHLIVAGSGVLWIADATNTLWRFDLPK
jgi:streptogramin lyase